MKNKNKAPENYLGPALDATELTFDVLSIVNPLFGVANIPIKIINKYLADRNLNYLKETIQKLDIAAFDFSSLGDAEKANFIVNMANVCTTVANTRREKKVTHYAALVVAGWNEKTIFSSTEDRFEEFEDLLDQLSETEIELLLKMDKYTRPGLGGEPFPKSFEASEIKPSALAQLGGADDNRFGFDNEDYYRLWKLVSLGLVEEDNGVQQEPEGSGTKLVFNEVKFTLTDRYFSIKKYLVGKEKTPINAASVNSK